MQQTHLAMTAKSDSPSTARLAQRILGSFLSALVGWTAVSAYYGVIIVMSSAAAASHVPVFISNQMWQESLGYFAIFAVVSAIFIFGTWFVALLPLYLLVPLHSILWRWHVCTVCGFTAGAAIMLVFGRIMSPPQVDSWPYVILAGIVGGVTCLFASLTRHRFHYDRHLTMRSSEESRKINRCHVEIT
jgi:hypothetical protein